MLSALLLVVGLSACNPKEAAQDYTVTEVNLKNINSIYHTSDTINFANANVEVKFKNADSVTLTKGEFDIVKENAKADTEFILYTNGLSAQTAGELEEGEYELSVYIISSQTTKEDIVTITVTSDLSTKYNLYGFTAPESVTIFNENKADISETEEGSFFRAADAYWVGDDNEFRFKPILEIGKTSATSFEADNYKVVVKVNGQAVVEGQQYDLFKYENFKFYFKDGTTWTDENNTFTISVTPADFTQDAFGDDVTPVTFTVKVADGYNVYDAVDLGRLSLVSDDFKAEAVRTTYERWQSGEVFYNGSNGFKKVVYYQLWNEFLTSKGKTNLQPVNGMFIHNDLTIDPAKDIPAEYLISVDEARRFTNSTNPDDYNYLVNSFRDEGWLYPHYMENDFIFNGNMFKLDFSNIKWCLSNSDGSTGAHFYYTKDQANYFMGHAVLFGFLGKTDNTSDQKAIFQNVESIGNSKNVTKKTDKEANEASGSFIYLKSDSSEVDVDNCIAKAFMIAFYSEYNIVKENANNGLDVSYSKIYDCYNSGLFSYCGENNTLTNSELKRFGGPTILLVNGTANDMSKEAAAEWIIDDKTVIVSEVTGEEAWFALLGVSNKAADIISLSGALYLQTDNYFAKPDNGDDINTYYYKLTNGLYEKVPALVINMDAVALESAYIGSNEPILYNYFKIGNSGLALNMGNPTDTEQIQAGTTIYTLATLSQKDPSTWTQEEIYAYNEAMAFGLDNAKNVFIQVLTNNIVSMGSPVFLSNGGTMAHFVDENYTMKFVNIDGTIEKFITEMMHSMQDSEYEPNFTPVYDETCHAFEGDVLYLVSPVGNTTLVAVVDLYTKEAQA